MTKKDHILSGIIFIAVFTLYLLSGYGWVAPYRDSGDLAAAAFSLGIPHPPGYVLYVLMGKITVFLIPWGNVAYRLNIMSIIAGALTVVMVFYLLRHKTGRTAALAGAAACALCPAVWRLSQVTEMYSLNICFGAFILWLLVSYGSLYRVVLLSALLSGIGLANHQTLMFFFPGYLVLVWYRFGKTVDRRILARLMLYAGVFFTAGLMVYAFLPVRSMTDPSMDWGDPQTLRNFWRMISRSDYGLFKLHPEESVLSWTFAGLCAQSVFFGKALLGQVGWVGIGAGFCGMWYALKKGMLGYLGALFVFSGPVFVFLANLPVQNETSLPILEPNLMMPALIWSVWVGLGVHLLASSRMKYSRVIAGAVAVSIITAGAVACRGRGVQNRNNLLSYDYGKNIFRSMEPGSILFNPDDSTAFITEYFKIVGQKRRDIRTMVYYRTLWGYRRLKGLYPEIMPEGSQDNAQEFLDLFFKKNAGVVPMYADLPFKFPETFSTVPSGLTYRLKAGREKRSMAHIKRSEELLELYPVRLYRGLTDPDAFFSRQVLSYYTSAENNTGVELMGHRMYKEARRHYMRALVLDSRFTEGYSNLGALEYRTGGLEAAENYFKMALKGNSDDPEGLYHLGITLKAQGNKDESLLVLKRVVPEGQYGAYALNEIGLVYLSRSNFSEAKKSFSEAISIFPTYTLPYYNLGLTYQRQNDYYNAVRLYRSYLERITDLGEKKEVTLLIARLMNP